MFRNREIQMLLVVMVVISGLAIYSVILFPRFSIHIVIILSILLMMITFIFTNWRYREIRKLSGYLRKISRGDVTLDVRDNKEGELSMLKNDIYKVTLMLWEQGTSLQRDKSKLTEAISDISHQLKTPVTSMMVMADLLSHSRLSEEKRLEFTRNIRVQMERMEWLVSSLLKLSKIDAGSVQFKRHPIVVRELIDKSTEPLLIPMDIKHQTLEIHGESDVSYFGDFNWTSEALINILKNCVEHTPEKGKVTISYSENVLFTQIQIVDNGKGIAKKDLPYIFKRFYKGKNAGEDSIGIGLALAEKIITSQHGSIEVTSKVGHGTEFTLKFYKHVM
ncbi:HAMP domain-containing histidine kinase [Salipaludibacillus sp. LMS25]|uniref:HAMP domain-containing sensor histidine kinase n=1 Tax=Salipaludibacillus sp. LMS25 TaxID=2924031 RepID=UPI0020D07B96|nr:HAMP domain-containing sensor histidine kinase [Salipaludibacillus sp. LMS25]UTR16522.1 HAMP domain-containing histidine kinase [Salipaludibacillus sp. LMS25]